MLWVSFLAGMLLALQSAWALVDGIRFLRFVRKRRTAPLETFSPFAAVVIPCKGVDAGFEQNLGRFLNQDYPNYQVVFVVATAQELIYRKLLAKLEGRPAPNTIGSPKTTLVVAGHAEGRGEKVNNLLCGIKSVDRAAQVFVFADIDAAPSPDWLRSLVASLADTEVTVSTGFRWYLPGKGFVSRLRAAWDASIATRMGDHDHNFAWGGSMAIRATDFHRMGVAHKYWANTASDDYALTRAVRDVGGKIGFEPRCLVASREESSLREFLRWSTRQIIITRVYASHLWRLGLAAYLLYCGAFTLGLIVMALPRTTVIHRGVEATILLLILLLGAAKGHIRTLVARENFASELSGHSSCYWLLSPLVPWIMLGNFVVAGFARRIKWRGTEYELVSKDEVRVISRTNPWEFDRRSS